MPPIQIDPAVERFFQVVPTITGKSWARIKTRHLAEFRTRRRTVMRAVTNAPSAAEASKLRKRVADELKLGLIELDDAGHIRLDSSIGLTEVTAFALQKRDRLGMDLVREWFEPFDDVGVHLDDLLKNDD